MQHDESGESRGAESPEANHHHISYRHKLDTNAIVPSGINREAIAGHTYCWIRAKLFCHPCWLFHSTIAIIVYRAQEVGVIDMDLLWTNANYWTYPRTRC